MKQTIAYCINTARLLFLFNVLFLIEVTVMYISGKIIIKDLFTFLGMFLPTTVIYWILIDNYIGKLNFSTAKNIKIYRAAVYLFGILITLLLLLKVMVGDSSSLVLVLMILTEIFFAFYFAKKLLKT